VQFTSTSSANAVEFYWQFPGGTPDTSTAQNPVVTYDAPGTYGVTLIVSNAAGSDTLVSPNAITVASPPSAGFVVTVSGASASFSNTSAHADTYSWDFGDGNTSTEQSPQHTYAGDGTYTVTLTATGPCGTSTSSQTVTIATPPIAGFTASPTADCGPLTVQFSNASSNNTVELQWFFPGGIPSSSTEQNPVVMYTSTGTYSVTLIATNAQGNDTLTQANYIHVFADAQASFTSSVNGATVSFQNTSSNATPISGTLATHTSTEGEPTHTYAQDGTYTVH
jgi:FOG: PKD repeat